jgi:hypothetical protein
VPLPLFLRPPSSYHFVIHACLTSSSFPLCCRCKFEPSPSTTIHFLPTRWALPASPTPWCHDVSQSPQCCLATPHHIGALGARFNSSSCSAVAVPPRAPGAQWPAFVRALSCRRSRPTSPGLAAELGHHGHFSLPHAIGRKVRWTKAMDQNRPARFNPFLFRMFK